MMKKLAFIFGLLITSTNAHALIDLGVVGGLGFSSGTPPFVYGLTGSITSGTFESGLKVTTFSPASSFSQVNALAQFKYSSMGFFVGLNLGLGFITNSLVSTASTNTFIYGPTIGYYMGSVLKYGLELDYNMSNASNYLTPMLGIKVSF